MADIPTLISALQTIKNNETAASITNFGGAVQMMQAAGNSAVGQLGPAIDQLSGSDANTMKITQWAWQKNGSLAGVNSGDSASREDVDTAGTMLQQMVDWYSQAYRLAKSLGYTPPKTAPAAAPAPAYHPTAPAHVINPAPLQELAATPSHAMSKKDIAVTAGGGVLGLLVGARFAGMMLGGPLGFVAGSALGYLVSKGSKG